MKSNGMARKIESIIGMMYQLLFIPFLARYFAIVRSKNGSRPRPTAMTTHAQGGNFAITPYSIDSDATYTRSTAPAGTSETNNNDIPNDVTRYGGRRTSDPAASFDRNGEVRPALHKSI